MQIRDEERSIEPRVKDPGIRALPAGLFSAWRRAISWTGAAARGVGPRMRALARSWVEQWGRVRAYHTGPALPWDAAGEHQRETAAAVGTRAFVFGLVLTGLAIATTTSRWLPIAVGIGSQVLWSGVRFIIIAVLMPRGSISRRNLSTAYLAGLLPYAFGATWLLQLAALLASANLTLRGLTGAGVARDDARTAVVWAFGGQAAILVGGWVLRAIIVLVAG